MQDVTQLQNALPRRPMKLVSGSNIWPPQTRKRPHLRKHLRRATNLPMLMRKKSVPCKQNTQCQAREKSYPISDQHGQNLYPFFNPNHSKTIHFGAAHIYSPYKGVSPLPPPPSLEGMFKWEKVVLVWRVILLAGNKRISRYLPWSNLAWEYTWGRGYSLIWTIYMCSPKVYGFGVVWVEKRV